MGKYLTEKQARDTAVLLKENKGELEYLKYYTLRELKMILKYLGGNVEETECKASCRKKIMDIYK